MMEGNVEMLTRETLLTRVELTLACIERQRAQATLPDAEHPFMTIWDMIGMIGEACKHLGLHPGAVDEIEVEYEVLPWHKENSYTVILGGSECYVLFDHKFQCFSVMSFEVTNTLTNTSLKENQQENGKTI